MSEEHVISANPSLSEAEKIRLLAPIYKRKFAGDETVICAVNKVGHYLMLTQVVDMDEAADFFDENKNLKKGIDNNALPVWLKVYTTWAEGKSDRNISFLDSISGDTLLRMLKADRTNVRGIVVDQEIWIPKDMLV